MATVLSQYSTTGFYKAPVSKGLMGGLFLTCTAINVPLLAHLRHQLECRLPDMLGSPLFYRLVTSRLAFVDTKDLVCSALLIYYFRIFERRYGSRKFASHLLVTWTLSTVLEVLCVLATQRLGLDLHPGRLLPPGPYGLVFPLFVPYLFDVPRVTTTHILGAPVTGKTLTYLIGLQICSTSAAAGLSAACGIAAGLLYRCSPLRLGRLRLPAALCWLADSTLGRLLSSSPPTDGPMAATLEAQRQQQIDMLEQQMLLDRYREMRQRNAGAGRGGAQARHQQGQGYAEQLVGHGDQPLNGLFFGRQRAAAAAAAADHQPQQEAEPAAPSEACVRHLVEMGFQRDQVEDALRTSNNDINVATTLLLQQS
ncbi:ubiquitin-associated domain-containing protein 2-like isoform X2 [Amphibalanus amphitrite]|uniref:ubiquitin-associated domain-containing protein 2-like isoform X2 n=1 Tax=Amphibalanus amphitrite TaxID=1232801 RepID=UPI001C906859|nr:ubiquitin-associated domain-containing protein 2-like isoform X2 [Amphibalanus amphitrite]